MGLLHLENLKDMMKFTEILFVMLTLSLGNYAGGDIPLQVTRQEGETVTLPCSLNLTHPIEEVTWMFKNNGKIIVLAKLREQKFIRVNKNYFINCLEGSNSGTSLQIRELRIEDSGIFTAHILVNGEMREISYNLTVYEPLPIPTPVIEKTDGNSTDLCHLHCSVPSNSTNLSYSWIYRDNDTDILYANGSTISVSLKDKTSEAEFLCLVQNPAHTNNVSVALYPCAETQTGTKTEATERRYVVVLIIAIILICVGTLYYFIRQKRIKSAKEDLTYSDFKTFPKRNINQDNTHMNGHCDMAHNRKSEEAKYADLSVNEKV